MSNKTAARIITIVVAAFILIAILFLFTGCNRQMFDATYKFDRAVIFLPDGEKIEGKVSGWIDFDGSDMIQVTIEGKTYLTHSANVILISK